MKWGFSTENQMVGIKLRDQGVDERTILKWVLKIDVGWAQLPEHDPVVAAILCILFGLSGSLKGIRRLSALGEELYVFQQELVSVQLTKKYSSELGANLATNHCRSLSTGLLAKYVM
jgi:hypothetical protein